MRVMTDPALERRRPRRGKLLWALIPAAAFVALLTVAAFGEGSPPAPGDPAPDFEAGLLDEPGTLSLRELRGKPVVLNFWASWCPPCYDEAPLLRRAHEEYGSRVAFVGVNIKDARADALRFDREMNLRYPDVRDESLDIYDDYGLTGQPETFFIDDEGTVVEHVNGPLTEDVLFSLLDILVARAG